MSSRVVSDEKEINIYSGKIKIEVDVNERDSVSDLC